MDAEAFMRGHAEKAAAGKIPEVLPDLTPEAMQQLAPMAGSLPNPMTGYDVAPVSSADGDYLFNVTYTGEGKSMTMRETVREVDGTWRIVKIETPTK